MLNALTEIKIRSAKPKDRIFKLFDGGGLYLEVMPTGSKRWRLKYRFDKKEKSISFGVYPTVSLKDVRDKRDEAKKILSHGIDPSKVRKAAKDVASGIGTFEFIGREWHGKFSDAEWAKSHSEKIINRLEKDVFPWIGSRPISEITAPDILNMLRKIETRGHLETVHRALSTCGQIFRYAIATSRATNDPTFKLSEAFPKPIKKHFSALIDPKDVKPLLQAIDCYHGSFIVKSALQLLSLVFLRPSEVRLAEWQEFDLDKAEWKIPIQRMKRTRRDKEAYPKDVHLVPLATQTVAILKDLKQYTGDSRLLFPSERGKDRPISDATLINALRRMGFGKSEMHAHGFRAMARTMISQQLGISSEYIERQLSHSVKGPLGSAYDRTTYLPERYSMMQKWADYLDQLKSGKLD